MRATVFAALLAFPAWGQDAFPQILNNQAAIGRVLITNQSTTQVDNHSTHQVGAVEVFVHYLSTPNASQGVDPRDIVTITVPEGYVAIPSEVLLPEGETVEVLIYEALLG
jgi:hypothetical protein